METNKNNSHDQEWVINISQSLEEDLEENDELSSIRIFSVPKPLFSSKPEAYTPQVVALGPYHHRRLEPFEVERHKLAAARKLKKKLKLIKFCDLVDHIAENENHIRSCYHRYLDFNRQTLAWMLAIDVSFLYQFLRTYPDKRQRSVSLSKRNSLKMGYLMDLTRRKTFHQVVLRDVTMLENQIPLFLLREVHGFYHSDIDEDNSNQLLASMLIGFCKDLAPIKQIDDRHFKERCFEKAHLLDLLYDAVAPKMPFAQVLDEQEKAKAKQEENDKFGCFRIALCSISGLICFVFKLFHSVILVKVSTMACKIIASFLKLRGKNDLSDVFSSAQDVLEEAESTALNEKNESPLVEEIEIPSVAELSKIGVKFEPTKGGLNTIQFDIATATFRLPVIHLNDNSEVVLRNLVAYEACIAPERMVLTRYTELMNGIIDTEEDVRILRESGVLLNRLKSDKAVASLWNGMTISVKATKVPILDKAIEGANAYYSGSWKVKVKKTMKKYVYSSWPCLTFLAANIFIFLSVVEAFCSMYSCSKWLKAE
ncbi:hypothetical protein L6164_024348 [Bauhinia variegata]|nr:hypothetical protein L6164_024348 [Bauhinia variegata]